LDLGDKGSSICIMRNDGEVVERSRVSTAARALRRRFGLMAPARVAIEAGAHSPWVSRLLASCGHEVLVANPHRLQLITHSHTKNDRVDAEWLARVARMDARLLSPIRHRGEQAQADLAVIRARAAAVRARTVLVNHIRGAAKAFGAKVPKCSAESLHRRHAGAIPQELSPALAPLLETLGALTEQIHGYDRTIEAMATRYPESALLRQVPGVGALTAIAFLLTVDDPHRFHKSRMVGSYFGLRPRQRASGDRDPQLRITKAGDTLVRQLLVQAAHYILGPFGPDTALRRKGLALVARGGGHIKKKAIVAVARRLAVLLHRLWVTGEVYEPLRNCPPIPERSLETA
jgi:transposase